MAAALERIRAELGPDAVVVESHPVPRRFWQKPWIEVAASDGRLTVGDPGPTPALPQKNGRSEHPSPSASMAPSLRPLWDALRGHAVDDQLALELVAATAAASDPTKWTSAAHSREALTGQIEQRVHTTGPLPLRSDQPTLMAIVGPTGVGKTTTIAKLATCAQSEGLRVALVTVDTYRAGALEQIDRYAKILGIPIRIAYTPAELRETIDALQSNDLILIDTPGCGFNNRTLLQELDRYLAPLGGCEVHLALSCGTQLADMMETTRAFGGLQIAGLILTKVDEAVCLGPALSLLHRSGTPVSYLTTGQNIPADVEIATPRRLAELLVAGKAA